MNKTAENILQKFSVTSKGIFIVTFVCVALSVVLTKIMSYLNLDWAWLETIPKILLVLVFIGFIVWVTAPGVLIFLGAPQLANAWFRGISPIRRFHKSWEQMSNDEKFPTYKSAIGLFLVALVGMAGVILKLIDK